MKLALIPARGGSKRIPDKNIRPFCGAPILSYPIRAALESGCFDRVIVSTDSERIAEEARRFGAETPFLRPPELSGDFTPTVPVVQHAIEWLQAQGSAPSGVCCIYATAPFVQPADLREGLRRLGEPGASFAVAVTRFNFPIQRALRITPEGRLGMLQPDQYATRSQDLEPAYHDAGQFYWGTAAAWRAGFNAYREDSYPVLIPSWRVQDIDDLEDWHRAELLHRALRDGGAPR